MTEPPAFGRPIAGAWRRIGGFLLDGLVLALVGSALGFSFFHFFASLGFWARLFGFAIAMGYFTYCFSDRGGGRTIGMRLAKLEVVDSQGGHLPMGRSLVRALVLAGPFFLNGVPLPFTTPGSALGGAMNIAYSMVLALWAMSLAYLFIFNRRTRQSIHDLAAGSFVVRAEGSGAPAVAPIWPGHGWIILGIAVVLAVPSVVMGSLISHSRLFRPLFAAQRDIAAMNGVRSASVTFGYHFDYKAGATERFSSVNVIAFVKFKPADYEQLAERIARVTLAAYPEARDKDVLNVTVIYGFDLGIAVGSVSHSFSHAPSAWPEPADSISL